MDEQKLLKLKKEIEEAKTEVSELKGSRKHLMSQLTEQWECNGIDQANKKLEELKKQETELQQEIQANITKLEEKYEIQ